MAISGLVNFQVIIMHKFLCYLGIYALQDYILKLHDVNLKERIFYTETIFEGNSL